MFCYAAKPRRAQSELVSKGVKVTPHRNPTPALLLQRAATDPARPLDTRVQAALARRVGEDQLRAIRVHHGPASHAAAESIGARAYTIGRDIHLGEGHAKASDADRLQLLAHEAIHAVQQGTRHVPLTGELAVSRQNDQAEVEAERIAESTILPPSIAGLSAVQQQNASAHFTVSRVSAPLIQRDLKNKYAVKDGTFDVDLKTESHPGAKSGMSGTIKFLPDKASPDARVIKLLQVVRDEDLSTGKDYVWTGSEANRNKMTTTADKAKGVTGGFFVDHSAAAATPRTAKADAAVSPYYRTYWPNSSNSQDGTKSSGVIKEASLWDYPGSSGSRRFTFETVAKGADTGYGYAALHWGFTISDPGKGTVDHEHASAARAPSATFKAAVGEFDKFYRNPGSSTAP